MNSETYLKWAAQTKHPPLTRTQKEFAEFLIEHKKEIVKIGELETVFKDVRNFLKLNNE
jgi:hypothetical protein